MVVGKCPCGAEVSSDGQAHAGQVCSVIKGSPGRAYGVVMGVANVGHTGVGGGALGIIIRSGGGPPGDTVRLMAEVSDGKGPRMYNTVWVESVSPLGDAIRFDGEVQE